MVYDMKKIVTAIGDWMKEANCYEDRKPITISILNNHNLDIVTPDAGRMIGKKGLLIKKYTKIFREICNNNLLQISIGCPNVMVSIGSAEESVIIYCNDNI